MEQSLPKDRWDLLQLVREEATRGGLPLYIVGGSVRDLVLGRRLNDFDLTVEGEAIRLARTLASGHGGRVTVHTKFGTAKWFLPKNLTPDTSSPDTLDLISARSETYKHPAALPTVEPGSLFDDLRRRDFTINAIAFDPRSQAVFDPLNGISGVGAKRRKGHSRDRAPRRTRGLGVIRALKGRDSPDVDLSFPTFQGGVR